MRVTAVYEDRAWPRARCSSHRAEVTAGEVGKDCVSQRGDLLYFPKSLRLKNFQ